MLTVRGEEERSWPNVDLGLKFLGKTDRLWKNKEEEEEEEEVEEEK